MAPRSLVPRLTDVVAAIERVRQVLGDLDLDAFEANWEKQWLVERGVEIVSEASRHLTFDLKARHADIPWKNVADIGYVLRHADQDIAAHVIWSVDRDHMPALERVCREELAAALAADKLNADESGALR